MSSSYQEAGKNETKLTLFIAALYHCITEREADST